MVATLTISTTSVPFKEDKTTTLEDANNCYAVTYSVIDLFASR